VSGRLISSGRLAILNNSKNKKRPLQRRACEAFKKEEVERAGGDVEP
jgi:hypothetical protein